MRERTDKLIDAVAASLARCHAAGKRLCAAVSGGKDSVALLHALTVLCDKADLTVLHVEHGIRGARSKSDAANVERLCADWGVRCTVVCADAPGHAARHKQSLEAAARDCRLNAFDELIGSGRADYVLTAHHADDQSETILLHILRGTGLRGLAGMREKSGYILRPLLSLSRAQIEDYVAAHKLPFVTDETNLDEAHDRNYLRNRVLPLLRARWDLDGSLTTLSRCATEATEYIDETLDDGVIFERGAAKIEAARLLAGGAAAAAYVLRALDGIGAGADIERKHIEAVIALSAAQNGKRIDLKNGMCAAKEYGEVTLYRRSEPIGDNIPFAVGVTMFLNGTLSVRNAERLVEPGMLRFDGDKLPPDAVVRTRQTGDTFCPFGGGRKTLKEYLIDKKIPRRLRDALPLIAAGNEILVIVGVEISDTVKLTPKTVNALEAEYEW